MRRLPELATELVRAGVDVIVTSVNPATLAAKEATTTIPIVMTVAVEPIAAGLVTSLAKPGANVTGLTFDAECLCTKSSTCSRLKHVFAKGRR
jgi:putative ABC transport system substrate-binding protein